jgi:hypothetical protein
MLTNAGAEQLYVSSTGVHVPIALNNPIAIPALGIGFCGADLFKLPGMPDKAKGFGVALPDFLYPQMHLLAIGTGLS